jgi:hypothetical protein
MKQEKCTGHKMCISFLSTIFVRNIFQRDKYAASYAQVTVDMRAEPHTGLHLNCLLLLCEFKQNWACVKTC